MIYENILLKIGNTPTVRLRGFENGQGAEIYAKLEGENPTGSIKDRVALNMIEMAERRGDLKPGMTILEATSGNMGISLAMVGARRGYPVHIVMSERMSSERGFLVKSYGARLELTGGDSGTMGALERARELVEGDPGRYWLSDQFNNTDNTEAHYRGTAAELLRDLKDIGAVVAGVGTGGTLMGIARRFREYSPETRVFAVIPPGGYRIQGLQNPEEDFSGEVFRPDIVDDRIYVSRRDAFLTARRLAREDGIFAGMSSGAAVCAAEKVADITGVGKIAVIIPDRGDKYLSTGLFE
ncbi:MAG: PLP-dependent cysteine synthase family protein [Candidatus Krumholzibacteriota bacterium]|nr:PLP-dependent cysteine synthase family protein [Candidatus Krumholzibacteriota bacterium]